MAQIHISSARAPLIATLPTRSPVHCVARGQTSGTMRHISVPANCSTRSAHSCRHAPVFLLVLSKAAFASDWVRQECKWAFNLYRREQNRIMLPIVAQQIDQSDWNAMLWLEDFRRVEGPGEKPYPQHEAIGHTLRLLALTPAGEAPGARCAPTDRECGRPYYLRPGASGTGEACRGAGPLRARDPTRSQFV